MSKREDAFAAWKARNPDIAPELYFALKIGTPITQRCEENIAWGFVDLGDRTPLEYIAQVYGRVAKKRETTVSEMLEHLVPDWAK